MENIYVQAIATFGLIITTALSLFYNGKYRTLSDKLAEAVKEKEELSYKIKNAQLEVISNRIRIFKEIRDVRKLYELEKSSEQLFTNTRSDRFLVIVAFNGKSKFNFVTVIYQKGADGVVLDAVETYNHLEIDDAYNTMLKDTERIGFMLLDTLKMDPCLLKDIYMVEGVKHSLIRFVCRETVDDENDIMAFTSTATHEEGEFTLEELTRIHIIHTTIINRIIKAMILSPVDMK